MDKASSCLNACCVAYELPKSPANEASCAEMPEMSYASCPEGYTPTTGTGHRIGGNERTSGKSVAGYLCLT